MEQPSSSPSQTLEENVRAIKAWEEAALHGRSHSERFSEWITSTAGRGPALVAHLVWFASWAAVNLGLVPGLHPFDRFPFPLLTMMVSFETIFLALFVLSSQNRLATQADKRAHLDLQINLLAEAETTKNLRLLEQIADKVGVPREEQPGPDLDQPTDIVRLATRVEKRIPESS